MHCFILHQLFQQSGGRFPINRAQFQKADIEPGSEQAFQVRLQSLQGRFTILEAEQFRAHFDQELHTIRNGGKGRQQFQARRFQSAAQPSQGNGAHRCIRCGAQFFNGAGYRRRV